MIEIDGALGEGGGQVVRTSLSLSLVTGRPVRLRRIRAGRERPGLRPQHLTAVRAAAEVGDGEVAGAAPGSEERSRARPEAGQGVAPPPPSRGFPHPAT